MVVVGDGPRYVTFGRAVSVEEASGEGIRLFPPISRIKTWIRHDVFEKEVEEDRDEEWGR